MLQFARNTYDAFRRLPQLPAAYLHPWRRESIRRLAELKDIHKGRRAFIIGNGPSLKQTDLSKLKNEITFGMNRIYLLFDRRHAQRHTLFRRYRGRAVAT